MDINMTQFRSHQRFRSGAGSRVADEYSSRFDKDGRLEVYKSGETNLYAKIQSYKDSVNLELIVERFRNGDQTALQQKVGTFFDCTNLPRTLIDAYNLLRQGEQAFMELPADVRAQYHHSFPEFLSNWVPSNGSSSVDGKVGVSGDPPKETDHENK